MADDPKTADAGARGGAPGLDPDPEEMRRLGYRAVDLAVEWLERLPRAPVARMPRADVLRPLVDEPLPRAGTGAEAAMERFMRSYLDHATLVSHPRFFAYIPCPGSYVGALGEFLAAVTNLFTGTWLGGAVAAQLEEQVLHWIRDALGLPAEFGGVLTSGGSLANLSALAAARTRIPTGERAAATVYTSTAAHYSLAKAARILGFADAQVRAVPTGPDQRLDPAAVADAMRADRAAGLRPAALCATFGTTTTGAIDPIDALADVAAEQGVWLHVDGAYGAAALLLPEYRAAAAALARADSLTLDPHKWLYSPFEAGCFLTRDLQALKSAFTADGEYMQDIPREEVNMYQRGPELSRGNRALKLWVLLRAVGTDGLAAAIANDLRRCRRAHDLLAADPRLEIVSPPQLSVFCFAARAGEEVTRRLMDAVLEDGYLMLSSSRIDGRYVLRFCVLNHRTTDADIDTSALRIRALLDAL